MNDAAAEAFTPAAREALAAFGVEPAALRFVHVSENVTFRVTDARDGSPLVLRLPHHTAIVLRVIVPGALLEVVEQNVPLPGSTRPDKVVFIGDLGEFACV